MFGIGFPPFIGGPFRLLDIYGTQKFIDRMYRYRDAKGRIHSIFISPLTLTLSLPGEQFEPAQILKDYAAANKKFHN